MKPFKAPTVVRQTPANSQRPVATAEPPLKRRRVSDETDDDDHEVVAAAAKVLKQSKAVPKFVAPAPRKPLAVVENPSSSVSSGSQEKHPIEGYYTVLW